MAAMLSMQLVILVKMRGMESRKIRPRFGIKPKILQVFACLFLIQTHTGENDKINEKKGSALDKTSDFAGNAWDKTKDFSGDALDFAQHHGGNAWDSIKHHGGLI